MMFDTENFSSDPVMNARARQFMIRAVSLCGHEPDPIIRGWVFGKMIAAALRAMEPAQLRGICARQVIDMMTPRCPDCNSESLRITGEIREQDGAVVIAIQTSEDWDLFRLAVMPEYAVQFANTLAPLAVDAQARQEAIGKAAQTGQAGPAH